MDTERLVEHNKKIIEELEDFKDEVEQHHRETETKVQQEFP